ncbi:histone acetyltransferases subunit 3-domain-containing protein [Panaeolus papilionaceus]|nr:histone acetyltransferases subunit 3-domain-containing protein [Panaeolus papilionaceus]
MSSRLTPYPQIPQIRSALLRHPPEAVPSIEELELLCSELKTARQKALDRAKRAEHDVKTVEDTWRRINEKEKGKSKAIDKIKRERDYTPNLDADDHPRSSSGLPNFTKNRNHLPHNGPSTSANRGTDPRKLTEELKKKKRKRKREGGESDVEPELQRPRKMSPPVIHPPPPPAVISKAQKSVISQPPVHNKLPTGPDFNVPPSVQLLPPRPPIPRPPSPGPGKSIEVTTDFTKIKAPTQTSITTFYSSIESYIRPIKEEDLGFLEYTADEVEPFIMPKLGRHYLEVWEDQDHGLLPPILLGDSQPATNLNLKPPAPTWDPSQLTEADLVGEDKGHGPLTERVISALLPVPDLVSWKGVKAAEDAMEGRPGGSGAAAARRERLNVTDLEARIRDTMRYHGLLDHVPDYSERVDDPIATALRQAQKELRRVVATNKARKARLAAIARDRLSYQEYLDARDTIDKNITTLFSRLQKKDAPKGKQLKKKKHGPGNSASAGPANGDEPTVLPLCPAAVGLSPDEDNHLAVNEQLRQLVETRRQWVDIVGSIFEEKEAQRPGQVYGLPKESIYAGIEEEVEGLVSAQEQAIAEEEQRRKARFPVGGSGRSSGGVNGRSGVGGNVGYKTHGTSLRGKEVARGDAMDIG